jgi:iron complex transport system substrate-binding protein
MPRFARAMRMASRERTWRERVLKKPRLLWTAAVIALLFAVACGGDDDDGTSGDASPTAEATEVRVATYPIDIDRSDAKRITFDSAPERVVSLSPGATEIFYALGAEESLVAVDHQADYPEAAASFATKVDAFQPNVEAIAALEPDLVLVATDAGGIVSALDALNIPTLFIDINTDITTIEQVFGQISIYGRITGKVAEATELITSLQQRVAAVRERANAAAEAPKVYHELDSSFYSAAEQSFIGDLYRQLNAENIAGDGGGSPYPQLTQEAIIAANPTVIILADEEFGVTVDSVRVRPGWGAIDAVRNNRIYGVDPDIISRPGPRIVDALEELADRFYPEGA